MGEISGVFARLKRINPAIKGEDAGMSCSISQTAPRIFDGNRLVATRPTTLA